MLNEIEKKVGRRIMELPHKSALYENPPVRDPKENAKKQKKRDAVRREAAEAIADASSRDDRRRKTIKEAEEGGRRKAERTLAGELDRPVGKKGKKGRAAKDVPEDGHAKQGKKKSGKNRNIIEDVFTREPGWQEARNERRQSQKSNAIGYTPQGVPEEPKALHAYVQIDHAPLPEKETTWDRLELSVGTNDGADVDKLTRFIIRT